MKQNMFLIKEKPHNVVEKPTHRAGNKMWENWMEKEMEIFPNFILEKKQKSTIFEFIINPKNGQPILEHDIHTKVYLKPEVGLAIGFLLQKIKMEINLLTCRHFGHCIDI